MRLFIAIQFTEEILTALTKLQTEWSALGMRGHAAQRQNLHLTLAFIGEYGDPDRVLEVMDSVPFTPFSLNLDGIGNFGDLYWAGIAPSEALNAYVKRLRRALAANGIPYDKKRFAPHITLVRRAEFHGKQELLLKNPPQGSMGVSEISLMSSTRGKNGMIYTAVGRVSS